MRERVTKTESSLATGHERSGSEGEDRAATPRERSAGR